MAVKICKHCGSPDVLDKRSECRSCHQSIWRDAKTESARRCRVKIKREVMEAYGGACACCGVTEIVFLAIDHIKGGGNEHRRSIGDPSAKQFYEWLKRNAWPSDFQVLCFNCNWAKSHGGCPHGNSAGQM